MSNPTQPSFDQLPDITGVDLETVSLAKNMLISVEPAPNMTESGLYVPNSNILARRDGVYRKVLRCPSNPDMEGKYIIALWPHTSYVLYRQGKNLVYVHSADAVVMWGTPEQVGKKK